MLAQEKTPAVVVCSSSPNRWAIDIRGSKDQHHHAMQNHQDTWSLKLTEADSTYDILHIRF